MKSREFSCIAAFVLLLCSSGVWALTNGPMQPEFTSFEPVDVTDLVNLPTGDFTYVLPLGDVKGPAGVGYPISLSYHAGITHEQEATWAGLGWNVNVGAIMRSVIGAPDDNFKARSISYMYNSGERNWSQSLGAGWAGFTIDVGWTNKGFAGVTGIGISYANMSVGADLQSGGFSFGAYGVSMSISSQSVGIGVGLRSGVGVGVSASFAGSEPTYMANISLHGAGISLASNGSFGMFTRYNSTSVGGSSQHNKDGLRTYSNQVSIGITIPVIYLSLSYSYAEWGWKFQQVGLNNTFGYLYHSTGLKQQVKTYSRLPAYLSKYLPSQWGYYSLSGGGLGKGTDFDFKNPFIPVKDNGDKLERNPSFGDNYDLPTQDIYSISAQGFSGSFKPFSHKSVRSVQSDDANVNGAFYTDITNDIGVNTEIKEVSPFLEDGIVFRMLGEPQTNLIDDPGSSFTGLEHNYSSAAIATGKTEPSQGTQIVPLFGYRDGDQKLDGFIITDQSGKRYHFTLPLRSLQQAVVRSNTAAIPATLTPGGEYSFQLDNEPYATMWLLTAITGPDYIKISGDYLSGETVDVADALLPRDGDWGYWVRFQYRYDENIDKAVFLWRNPVGGFIKDECSDRYTTTFGARELTYLSSIETPSELAYFRTEDRLDGKGLTKSEYPLLGEYIPKNGNNLSISTETIAEYVNGWSAVELPSNLINSRRMVVLKTIDITLPYDMTWYNQIPDKAEMLTLNVSGSTTKSWCTHDFWCWKGTRTIKFHGGIVIVKDPTAAIKPTEDWPLTDDGGKLLGHITKMVRCIDAVPQPGGGIKLTLAKFGNRTIGSCAISGLFLSETDACGCWDGYPTPEATEAIVSKYGFSETGGGVVTSQKRLKEIAWYSKTPYSYLNGITDPEEAGAKLLFAQKGFPQPDSYRRVVMAHNYALARGTPNSSATNPAGGRLTLNKVVFEAGPSSNPVMMPPYTFGYQAHDVAYAGATGADPWGYRKPDRFGPQDVASQGVNWNLSTITMPSGGILSMEYERDYFNSSLGALYNLGCLDVCGGAEIRDQVAGAYSFPVWPNPGRENLFIIFDVISVGTGNKIALNTVENLETGMIFVAGIAREIEYLTYVDAYYTFRIESIDIATKSIVYTTDKTPSNIPAGYKIFVLKKQGIFAGGLRVKALTQSTMNNSYRTIYSYGEGATWNLPAAAVPSEFNNNQLDGGGVVLRTTVSEVFPQQRYSAAFDPVIYPTVEVTQVDAAGSELIGKKRYHFWTADDKVTVAGTQQPMIRWENHTVSIGTASINVRQVYDYSQIIGLLKKVEDIKSAGTGTVIQTIENVYTFSEDLSAAAGVTYGGLSSSNRVLAGKPLGLSRECTIQKEHKKIDNVVTYTDKSLLSIISSKPYLTSVTVTRDKVGKKINYGQFDARTGQPLVAIETNSNGLRKLDLSTPAYHVAGTVQKSIIRNLNYFSLEAGKTTASVNNDVGGITPANFSWSTLANNVDSIKAATWTGMIDKSIYPGEGVPYSQTIISIVQALKWKRPKTGGAFAYPSASPEDWLTVSDVTCLDKYSRVVTELDAMKVPTTAVRHPKMDAVVAIVSNANREENGIYTCDYVEGNPQNQDYLDYQNAWEKSLGYIGTLPTPHSITICAEAKHFGKLGAKITNAFGPTRDFKLQKNRDYVLSAWIKSADGNVPILKDIVIGVDYRRLATTVETWPLDLKPTTTEPAIASSGVLARKQVGDWWHIELHVPASKNWSDISEAQWNSGYQYARAWVGAPKGNNAGATGTVYVDDIRFYPKDGLVRSFYYDAELNVPVAFVDENGKVVRFEYDRFGRLTHRRNNAGQLLRRAEYSDYAILDVVLNATEYFASETMTLKWTVWSPRSLDVYFSRDGGSSWQGPVFTKPVTSAGEVTSTWIIPATTIASENCLIKVQDHADAFHVAYSPSFRLKPAIELTYPQGGEIIAAGKHILVTWNQAPTLTTQADIQVSTDDGQSWVTKATIDLHHNIGITMPAVPTTLAKLRITTPSGVAPFFEFARSERFTLQALPKDITSPPPDYTKQYAYDMGQVVVVSWRTDIPPNSVNIRISKDNGAYTVLNKSPVVRGTAAWSNFRWILDHHNASLAGSYKMYIESEDGSYRSDNVSFDLGNTGQGPCKCEQFRINVNYNTSTGAIAWDPMENTNPPYESVSKVYIYKPSAYGWTLLAGPFSPGDANWGIYSPGNVGYLVSTKSSIVRCSDDELYLGIHGIAQ